MDYFRHNENRKPRAWSDKTDVLRFESEAGREFCAVEVVELNGHTSTVHTQYLHRSMLAGELQRK